MNKTIWFVIVLIFIFWSSLQCVHSVDAVSDSDRELRRHAVENETLKNDSRRQGGASINKGKNATTDHRFFLYQIFAKYGDNGVMKYEGFEHLLANLGLGGEDVENHDMSLHIKNGVFEEVHDEMELHQHGHESRLKSEKHEDSRADKQMKAERNKDRRRKGRKRRLEKHRHREKRHVTTEATPYVPEMLETLRVKYYHHYNSAQDTVHNGDPVIQGRCLTAPEILYTYGLEPYHSSISPINFLHLCPAIIYELDQSTCLNSHLHDVDMEEEAVRLADVDLQVWLYASLAVLIISLCGLFGVAVIPVMQKVFYHYMIQFLIAMAVGSLSGDALLHLLPHALQAKEKLKHRGGGHSHEEEASEEEAVWKGMTALVGLLFFFMAEKVLQSAGKCRGRKRLNDPSISSSIGKRLSEHTNSSRSVAAGEPTEKTDLHNDSTCKESYSLDKVDEQEINGLLKDSDMTNAVLRKHTIDTSHDTKEKDKYESLSEEKQYGHGHSHSHGQPPDSISAVAWMVIMGDGLHNFSDGMAIGAAFAAGVTGGFSTSVAVFCHELPHEMGDFAVLLKSGMSAKQALFYNIVSSVLCFVGMLIGITLANFESASMWIFAAAAGTFLYIALVDLVPELNNSQMGPDGSKAVQLLLQVLGMTTGGAIMLMIALYEHDLKSIFSS